MDIPKSSAEEMKDALEMASQILGREPSDEAIEKIQGEDGEKEAPSWEELDAKDEEIRDALAELKELNDLNYERQDEYQHIMMKLKKRLAKLDELYVETDELYKGDVADAIKEDKAKEAAEAQPAAADGGS